MDEIISLSSGSDGGSDVVFINTYQEYKEDVVPFIREEWLPVKPVLIDITDQTFTSCFQKTPNRDAISPIIIDLRESSDYSSLDVINKPPSEDQQSESQICFVEKDAVNRLRSDLSVHENSLTEKINEWTDQRSVQQCTFTHVSCENVKVLKNIEDSERENRRSSPTLDDDFHSPFNLDSPYYCPSEVDAVSFSDESNNDQLSLKNQQSSSRIFVSDDISNGENKDVTEIRLLSLSRPVLECNSKPNSPTSTEILASDTMAHSPDQPSRRSSTSSLNSFLMCSSPTRSEERRNDSSSLENSPNRLQPARINDVKSDLTESSQQQISLNQFRKLKQFMFGRVSHMREDLDEDEEFGSPEPLCRQSLSLVYSTIEENYPEGTLQLLDDFIQPQFYPPVDITKHLLKGIFLEPQSSEVLAIEAYNLLMKIQRYHPANTTSVAWDWELLTSVMEEHDDSKRLQTEIRCLLLQYVLKVLEDDFQFNLTNHRLHHSIAKTMLSCERSFGNVKDLIHWMMSAAEESVNRKIERDSFLKIVLSLQRMLTLALEVDKNPVRNSDKLSQELFLSLNRMSTNRRIRSVLLSSVENKLLKCKLLERLLGDACPQKSTLFMSKHLLLHYLRNATLDSDPSDGEERWKKWDEVLQLLWTLTLSYDEVLTGHLQCSITDRFNRTSSLSLLRRDDQVTSSEVREAVKVFISRATKDVNDNLPLNVQQSLTQLQQHITHT